MPRQIPHPVSGALIPGDLGKAIADVDTIYTADPVGNQLGDLSNLNLTWDEAPISVYTGSAFVPVSATVDARNRLWDAELSATTSAYTRRTTLEVVVPPSVGILIQYAVFIDAVTGTPDVDQNVTCSLQLGRAMVAPSTHQAITDVGNQNLFSVTSLDRSANTDKFVIRGEAYIPRRDGEIYSMHGWNDGSVACIGGAPARNYTRKLTNVPAVVDRIVISRYAGSHTGVVTSRVAIYTIDE